MIAAYIEQTAAMMQKVCTPIGKHPGGVFGFLTEHGREYQFRPLPDDVRAGPPQACFETCQCLAADFERFTYCEGYAAGIIPVLHAWVTDASGYVIDPTWTGGKGRAPMGSQYFGVAIRTAYVIQHMISTGHHRPILDDWSRDYPILRARVEDWKP